MKRPAWPFGSLGFITIAMLLLAAPARFEGPVLVPISPGHALSLLDSIALVPLLMGSAWLYAGVWVRRIRLYKCVYSSPGMSCFGLFVAGFGLGLLLASGFSSFFWWWALGAMLFGATNILLILMCGRS